MVTRLIGGLTPGDGADPRTFPAIFNDAADTIEAQGTAIADLEDLNPVQFGTAVASGGQVLAFSTAVSGYVPEDVFGGAVNGTAVYRFVDTVYFTSSGTFSKADYPWLRAIRVKCVGGGGGGSGANNTAGGGGSGGSYAESFITDIALLDASEPVTVGAGGAGGVGAVTGAAGGESTFRPVGGGGGGGGNSNGQGGLPTTPVGDGQLVIGGNAGGSGGDATASSGHGGGSVLGAGGRGSRNNANATGTVGRNYGGGGGGSRSTGTNNGAAGADGIVIVELYA
jgi:hypothetical protein